MKIEINIDSLSGDEKELLLKHLLIELQHSIPRILDDVFTKDVIKFLVIRLIDKIM